MTKTEIKKLVTKFNKLSKAGNNKKAESYAKQIIENMHDKKMHTDLADFAKSKLQDKSRLFFAFEVAFAMDTINDKTTAQLIYNEILDKNPNNTAALNNLSNIYKDQENYDDAFELITKAYNLDPEEEIIANNYNSLKEILTKKESINQCYKDANDYLVKETKWAFGKLETFVVNFKKEAIDGKMPISSKKWGWMMNTDEDKAQSLKEQWLERNYITDTGNRGDYSVHIYMLNPYLEDYIKKNIPKKLPSNWDENLNLLNIEELENLQYFKVYKKISKVKAKYKQILIRDWTELTLNHIFDCRKSVVILSGSIVETIFLYICEKKKIDKVSYTIGKKTVNKKLEDANIFDFQQYFEEKHEFNSIVTAVANVSRLYRNCIHTANEINKFKTGINKTKMHICFNSVIEVINETI